ncbi:MAG: hypothetical protein U9N46_14815 [Euryarchaeota archaeon]|nr:MAG: hypothetical protein C5S47_06185 [ANME-2 cluster archaeon]MEA1866431.1 hypothetical protein [Euryarchaeota archaeon]
MVCEYDQNPLINLLKHSASVNPEKIEAIQLNGLEEELWMG